MIYIVTDRRRSRDYTLLLDNDIKPCVYNWRTRSFPVKRFNDGDVVLDFCYSEHNIPKGGHRINNNKKRYELSSKDTSRKLMQANGIPVPTTWFDINDAKIPFIARPKEHRLGRNFFQINNEKERQELKKRNLNRWYYSEVIMFEQEYRTIVFGNEVLCSFRKDVGLSPLETVRYRRQNFSGYNNIIQIKEISDEQKQICIDASKLVGLDFSGIDILVDKDGMTYVCESNVTPMIRGFFSEEVKDKLRNIHKQIK